MYKSKIILSFLMFFLVSFGCFAQDLPPADEGIPVDGGISLLIAAGAIWGVKKLKEKN